MFVLSNLGPVYNTLAAARRGVKAGTDAKLLKAKCRAIGRPPITFLRLAPAPPVIGWTLPRAAPIPTISIYPQICPAKMHFEESRWRAENLVLTRTTAKTTRSTFSITSSYVPPTIHITYFRTSFCPPSTDVKGREIAAIDRLSVEIEESRYYLRRTHEVLMPLVGA